MNKSDLIAQIVKKTGLSKTEALEAFLAIVDSTSEALKKGDSIVLRGFGSFSVASRKARTGRNPQTGKTIEIRSKNVVRFKASEYLTKEDTGDGGPRGTGDGGSHKLLPSDVKIKKGGTGDGGARRK